MALKTKTDNLKDLEILAYRCRKNIIKTISQAKSGHPGGALGFTDIFTILYHSILKHDPENPHMEDRDRLIMSNGHYSALLYSLMAQAGYIEEKELETFRQIKSRLQGHPSSRLLPGVENSSGSLGQGLSVASGTALGAKLQKKDWRVFCSMSDGECAEGMTWEAAAFAVHRKLDNLIVFLDRNYIQIDGNTEDVMALKDLRKKFEAFGWDAVLCEGHNYEKIMDSFKKADVRNGKPHIIIFETTFAKGVSFMEGTGSKWHGIAPSEDEKDRALAELDKHLKALGA